MRRLLLLNGLMFLSLFSFSQNSLSFSRKTSVYTYIYRISISEAKALYGSHMTKLSEKYLYARVDSFRGEDDVPSLPAGNYLFTYAKDNQLAFELFTSGDVACKIIDNTRDLVIALHTKAGMLISDARVFIGNRQLRYDEGIQAYRLLRSRKTGVVSVHKDGTVYFFPITIRGYRPRRQWQYRFPFRYLVIPVKKLLTSKSQYRNYFRQTKHETKYRGFMVLNKPKYKPGDTVRVKAFIQSRSGIPVKAPLLLRLSGNYFAVDTILARLSPYRQGGYEGWFVLDNQLHLSLDQDYLLTLETLSSRKYEIGNDNGSLDKQEYALKRKVLIRCRFYYEDYELNTVRFFARSDRNEHSRGIPASLFLKAIDDNDMAVMDGRVQLLVRPSSVGKPQFHGHKVFLADTLWFKSRESGRKRITEQHALQKLLGALYPWPYRDFPFLTPR